MLLNEKKNFQIFIITEKILLNHWIEHKGNCVTTLANLEIRYVVVKTTYRHPVEFLNTSSAMKQCF